MLLLAELECEGCVLCESVISANKDLFSYVYYFRLTGGWYGLFMSSMKIKRG